MAFDFIISMILLISMIGLFNLTRCLFKVRKILKMHKDNPNIQGITIVNGEVKIIEKEAEKKPVTPVIPKVIDEVCGREVNKGEAYQVVVGDKEHYFCSWECREAFMKAHQEEGE